MNEQVHCYFVWQVGRANIHSLEIVRLGIEEEVGAIDHHGGFSPLSTNVYFVENNFAIFAAFRFATAVMSHGSSLS